MFRLSSKLPFSTLNTSTPKARFPWFKLTSVIILASGGVLGSANVAAHNPDFKKIWLENIPNGAQLIEASLELEQKLKNFSIESIQSELSHSVLRVGQSVDQVIKTSHEMIDEAKKQSNKVAETTAKYIDEASSSARQVADKLEQNYIVVSEKAVETRKNAEETLGKIYAGIEEISKKTAKAVDAAHETLDGVKRAVTGDRSDEAVAAAEQTTKAVENEKSSVAVASEPLKEDKTVLEVAEAASTSPTENSVVVSKGQASGDVEQASGDEGQVRGDEGQVGVDEGQVSVDVEQTLSPKPEAPRVVEDLSLSETDVMKSTMPVITTNDLEEQQQQPQQPLLSQESGLADSSVDKVSVAINAQDTEINSSEQAAQVPTTEEPPVMLKEDSTVQKSVDSAVIELIDEMNAEITRLKSLLLTQTQPSAENVTQLGNLIQRLGTTLDLGILDEDKVKERILTDAKREFEQEMEKIAAQVQQESSREHELQLAQELQLQAIEQEQLLQTKLQEQESLLKHQHESHLLQAIHEDRNDRLYRLELLEMKLKTLENMNNDVVQLLGRDAYIVKMFAIVKSLSNAFGKKNALAQSVEAMRKLVEKTANENASPLVAAVLDNLESQNLTHVPSSMQLEQTFYQVAKEIRQVQLMPDDGGPLSYMASWLVSHLILPKRGFVRGNDVESIIARSEYYLGLGDLDQAARELNQLQGKWTRLMAEDWLNDARKHLEIKQAIEARFNV